MVGQTAQRAEMPAPPPASAIRRKLVILLAHLGAGLLARLLETADGRTVAAVAARELSLILRSRDWHRFLGMWTLTCAGLFLVPLLYRSETGRWLAPSGAGWFVLSGYLLQGGVALAMVQWTVRRLRRDLYTDRLDELILTRCSPADLAMGEALASAVASLWLVAATFPVCLMLSALAGLGLGAALKLGLTLAPAGALGVWFGMGWALAFTLRRPGAALSPLTDWWTRGSLVGPAWIGWCVIVLLTPAWALIGLIPGGPKFFMHAVKLFAVVVQAVLTHWNPLLTVGAIAGFWRSTWFTDWLVLGAITLFMMRKSMDSIQLALGTLPERDLPRGAADAWVHHDVHFFMDYGDEKRRQPQYLDGGDAVAAFDVALGHRVYIHPFLWTVALMGYAFLVLWSLMIPAMGRGTAIAAVLMPATGALLMMSCGVAISFGWERDRHRWPALAILPIDNLRLALGKIKGVVRPTLWLGLMASGTAILLGWRGALDLHSSLWMALHVLVFPVTLAFVSATLALTTPTIGEAIYRWAVLGAIPTLATLLPPPIGGEGGLALPFTPPLLVLLLQIHGPTPALLRGAWISFGLETFGIAAALLILRFFLRQWTVGEKD